MKHNNTINVSLLSTILLCFALLYQCNATFPLHHHPPETTTHQQQFTDTPMTDDSAASSEAPQRTPTSNKDGHDDVPHGNKGHGPHAMGYGFGPSSSHGTPHAMGYGFGPSSSHGTGNKGQGPHAMGYGFGPSSSPGTGNKGHGPHAMGYGFGPSSSHVPHAKGYGFGPSSSPGGKGHGGHAKGYGFESSSSFSGSFSDLLKGTLRGHTLTMPEHITNSNSKHNQALKQICEHTDYPDVCVATIAPLLNRHDFDVTTVLQASIKACSMHIKVTIEKIAKMHHTFKPEHIGASLVADCREQYSKALHGLKRASDAVTARDIGTVTVTLSAVMADVSTCESGFADFKSSSFKVDHDGMVGIMASNCLAIAHLIPR